MAAYNKHLIVVGTARSGTSWLAELIATQHRYRILFEPEHEYRTPKGKLICDQWFNKTKACYPTENSYLKQVFSNTVDCNWIGQLSNRRLKRHLWPFIPKKYIIKFVRANLSAQYMNHHFGIPVLHLIRNPYEVIKSQLRVNFPWLFDLSIFSAQEDLVALVKTNYDLDITAYKSLSKSEVLCLRWCLENVIPLELLGGYNGKVRMIRYEELTGQIDRFIDLCQFFDLDPRADIKAIYNRPSSKAHPKSRYRQQVEPVQSYHLNPTDIRGISSILNAFKTQLYLTEPPINIK